MSSMKPQQKNIRKHHRKTLIKNSKQVKFKTRNHILKILPHNDQISVKSKAGCDPSHFMSQFSCRSPHIKVKQASVTMARVRDTLVHDSLCPQSLHPALSGYMAQNWR